MSVIVSRHKCILLHVDACEDSTAQAAQTDIVIHVAKIAKCPVQIFKKKWVQSSDIADLFDAVKRLNVLGDRNVLLLSGTYLEDQITLCTLEALAIGYDVHLLCDVIMAHDTRHEAILKLRLFQAGAVPTSFRQMLYMWHAAETDLVMAKSLLELLTQCDAIK